MELLNAAEFARLAGVSQKTISIALNPKGGLETRLDYYNGTRKIDPKSVKARAFLENIPRQRNTLERSVNVATEQQPSTEKFEDLTDAQITAFNAQSKKAIEEAKLKREQRIEKQLKNAVRRGELIELDAVNQMIMTWFDRWLQSNKRGFNGNFDGFLRDVFKLFENDMNADKKDFKKHEITKAELKKRWSDTFEAYADNGKQKTLKYLGEIQEEQARRK